MTGETEKAIRDVLSAAKTFLEELTGLARDVREVVQQECRRKS